MPSNTPEPDIVITVEESTASQADSAGQPQPPAQPHSAGQSVARPGNVPLLPPTQADLSYGPHERQKLDLFLPRSQPKRPRAANPLLLFIHGGGFYQGDKRLVQSQPLKAYLERGWAVAALNYRLTGTDPAPTQYHDCARALQFLRHHAQQWNLDPQLVASTGNSAGAGISLWLAFHDDLANPKSEDPVARQSTRLVCAATLNGQSSYDPRFAEKIGLPRPNFERHRFFTMFYGLKLGEFDTPEAYRRYEAFAPISYLTADDSPVMMQYTFANEEYSASSSLDLVVHHPRLGIALKEAMDSLGIECVVQYRSAPLDLARPGDRSLSAAALVRHGGGAVEQATDFIDRQFRVARQRLARGEKAESAVAKEP